MSPVDLSPKAPSTTELPDWDKAFDELFDRQLRLIRIISGLKALGREPGSLEEDLLELTDLLTTIGKMRKLSAPAEVHHRAA